MKKKLCILGLLAILTGISEARADWKNQIKHLARDGAVLALNQNGRVLYSYQPDKPLIPASVIKLITASAAFGRLGSDYRFPTDFYIDRTGNLYIKGYGDPLLISEELKAIAQSLAQKGLRSVKSIFVDDSFFAPKIETPGCDEKLDPYNAPVSALAANFNTIYVEVHADGTVTSKEPHTPMTDFTRDAARRLKIHGIARVNLGNDGTEYALYPGYLLCTFMEQSGIRVEGEIKRKTVPSGLPVFYRHLCRDSLEQIVHQMLKYSSNFIANQLFLTMGAKGFGEPATMEKGARAVSEFLAESLGVKNVVMAEGSGLSRMNRVTARQIVQVLDYFWPYHKLLPLKRGIPTKTGTLSDVKASAGYFTSQRNGRIRFVVMINECKNYSTKHRIVDLLKKNL